MSRELDKTETMTERSNWRTGVTEQKKNQREEMERSVEMSEIFSQTLNKLYTVPPLCMQIMCYVTSGAATRRATFYFLYQKSCNLIEEKRCKHINLD